jgi:hypothetical protein
VAMHTFPASTSAPAQADPCRPGRADTASSAVGGSRMRHGESPGRMVTTAPGRTPRPVPAGHVTAGAPCPCPQHVMCRGQQQVAQPPTPPASGHGTGSCAANPPLAGWLALPLRVQQGVAPNTVPALASTS